MAFLSLLLKDIFFDFQGFGFISNRKYKPFMKNRETILIEELLKNMQPKNCLEWGSGFSTFNFSRLIPSSSNWLAIEHDFDWAQKVKKMNENSNVRVKYIPPNRFPWTDENNDGSYTDLVDYVEGPKDFGPFDFIFIDGRSRVACLEKAMEWITDRGVVILHDSNRDFYHSGLDAFPNKYFFQVKGKKGNGICIATKKLDLNKYLDVSSHIRLGLWHDRLKNL